jgi:hypothetical protein
MVILTGFASLLVLVAALSGFEDSLAYAGPLLVMLLPLLAGRFVGEDRIVRLAVRRSRRTRRPPVLVTPTAWLRGGPSVPRGGRLIARGLAVRPPPLLAG